jgi:hypothetical protein
MTESISHLAGLWIGAAISKTSHSNKTGSTTAKEQGSQVKIKVDGSVVTKSRNNFPIGLHVMYVHFPETYEYLAGLKERRKVACTSI